MILQVTIDNVLYRECTHDDFDSIFRLLCQLWPQKPLDKKLMRVSFAEGMKAQQHYYLCAEQDDKIAGFCSLTVRNSLWQQGNLGHIDELIVDSEHRGKGIGKNLLNRMSEIAKEMHCSRIELDSAHHRVESHRFYAKNSFENRAVLFSRKLL